MDVKTHCWDKVSEKLYTCKIRNQQSTVLAKFIYSFGLERVYHNNVTRVTRNRGIDMECWVVDLVLYPTLKVNWATLTQSKTWYHFLYVHC